MPAEILMEVPKTELTSPTYTHGIRLHSIDIFRALTMVLMVFVNDLWSLKDIPVWLEHVSWDADGMGLADIVFPAFLFIVGMSLPLAVSNRIQKGETTWQIILHILSRSFALIVMGLFLVNGENINPDATGMIRVVFYSIACISFILIWNSYPASMNIWLRGSLKITGILALFTLAFIYRGGSSEDLQTFSIHWWGILGLIGWSYLTSALIILFSGNRLYLLFIAWVLFSGLSFMAVMNLIPGDSLWRYIPGPVLGGTLVSLTLAGVLTSRLLNIFLKQTSAEKVTTIFLLIGAALLVMGILSRPLGGISKIRATPSWMFLCSGISLMAFILTYWITDVKGKRSWFSLIMPAGTNTLLCYLLPYFAYTIVVITGITWPDVMLTGPAGLIKALTFGILCAWFTGVLNKSGIRLRI